MELRKSDIHPLPDFFDRYINLIDDITLSEALDQGKTVFTDIKSQLELLKDKIYAAEKWAVREVLQHCIDTERILSYRALRFARNDQTPLPGFDEELFARNTTALHRSVDDLLDEFLVVRESTLKLFRSFEKPMLLRTGICFNRRVSVLALGFIIAGHPLHHRKVIEERYFPLINQHL